MINKLFYHKTLLVSGDTCSSLEEGLVEYKKQFDIEPSDDEIFFMKSFGLR